MGTTIILLTHLSQSQLLNCQSFEHGRTVPDLSPLHCHQCFFLFSSTSYFPLFETQTKLELAIFHPSNFLKLDKTQDCLIQKILEMEI